MDEELAKAIIAADLEKVRQLLQNGANPNALYKGEPLLLITRLAPVTHSISLDGPKWGYTYRILKNYAPVTKLLVEYGARLDALNQWGYSVVTQARQHYEEELATYLLDLAKKKRIRIKDRPKKVRLTHDAPSEVIQIPGQKPGVEAVVTNVDKYSVWFLKKEVLVVLMNGRRDVLLTRRELQKYVSIHDEQTALSYARFLFSPGVRHILSPESYAEITGDSQTVLFRKHGIHADEARAVIMDGFEGIFKPEQYAKLGLEPTTVSTFGHHRFLIERNVVERFGMNSYKVFRVSELVSRDGGYFLREKKELPKIRANWFLIDKHFHW